MKKWMGLTVMAALLILTSAALAELSFGTFTVPWRCKVAAVAGGFSDSTIVQISSGATGNGTIDTSGTVNVASLNWPEASASGTGVGSLFIYAASAPTNIDTLFVFWDASLDASTWINGATAMNAQPTNANDLVIQCPLVADGDATGSVNGAQYKYPYWRFRVRADGANGVAMAAQLKLRRPNR